MVPIKEASKMAVLFVLAIIGTAGSLVVENSWSNLEIVMHLINLILLNLKP